MVLRTGFYLWPLAATIHLCTSNLTTVLTQIQPILISISPVAASQPSPLYCNSLSKDTHSQFLPIHSSFYLLASAD